MKRTFFVGIIVIVILSLAGLLLIKNQRCKYIFLITLDTTRADYINYSPAAENTLTPNFAKLASNGSYFQNAFSLIPITLPAHAVMLYSLPPHRLHIYNNGQVQTVPRPGLAQILKSKGYQTGAVISLGVLKREFGLQKGFNKYNDDLKSHLYYKTAAEVNRDARRLIKELAPQRSFFWIHYSDPHEPYFPPYLDGDFSVFVNSRQLVKHRLFAQPRVKLDLILQPGDNILSIQITRPESSPGVMDFKIDYIKYENVRFEPAHAEKDLELRLAQEWERRRTPRNTWHLYDNGVGGGQINLYNRSQKTLPVTLGFVLKVMVDEKLRRQFYGKQINYLDRHFGELLSFLKEENLFKDSVFIVVGDHGEGLGDFRDHFGHIHYLHKIYTRVPLILSGKGIQNGGGKADLVSILDVAPTILHLAGADIPEFMKGYSLLSSKRTPQLLLETYRPEAMSDSFSIIKLPHQLIYYPGKKKDYLELLKLDRGDTGTKNYVADKNLAGVKGALLNPLLKIAKLLLKNKKNGGKISREIRDMLETLGYL